MRGLTHQPDPAASARERGSCWHLMHAGLHVAPPRPGSCECTGVRQRLQLPSRRHTLGAAIGREGVLQSPPYAPRILVAWWSGMHGQGAVCRGPVQLPDALLRREVAGQEVHRNSNVRSPPRPRAQERQYPLRCPNPVAAPAELPPPDPRAALPFPESHPRAPRLIAHRIPTAARLRANLATHSWYSWYWHWPCPQRASRLVRGPTARFAPAAFLPGECGPTVLLDCAVHLRRCQPRPIGRCREPARAACGAAAPGSPAAGAVPVPLPTVIP